MKKDSILMIAVLAIVAWSPDRCNGPGKRRPTCFGCNGRSCR